MKHIKYILILGSAMLFGCAHNTKKVSETTIQETDTQEQTTTQVIHKDMPFGIEDMVAVGNMVVCKKEANSHVFVCFNTSNFTKMKEFGTIGRSHDEWIQPHIVARENNGYDIFDNGKNKILRYDNDTLVSETEYKNTVAVNNPHMINKMYGGYSYIEPNKIALVLYDSETYERTDEYAFEDEEKKGNAIDWDFMWDGEDSHIVIAHLYKKEFNVVEINEDGKFLQSSRYSGDYTFNPEKHVYYSDVNISNGFIYLLNQQYVNLEDIDGYSEIDIFDINGKCIKKLQLDTIAQRMCVAGDNIWLLDIENNLRVLPKHKR
ncbi:MAG: hypothetical protein K2F69_07095 [Bacteroidaceae bacterium]|nr:hypothetical protein [Bacteroidaceae bacterium]